MEVLDFIDIIEHDPESVSKAVNDYIASRKAVLETLDAVIRISICQSPKKSRLSMKERKKQLDRLIEMNPGLPTVYKDSKYEFDFSNRVFKQIDLPNGKARFLYLTASEILMVYQLLICRQKLPLWASFYSNMKSRLGADFLRGLV